MFSRPRLFESHNHISSCKYIDILLVTTLDCWDIHFDLSYKNIHNNFYHNTVLKDNHLVVFYTGMHISCDVSKWPSQMNILQRKKVESAVCFPRGVQLVRTRDLVNSNNIHHIGSTQSMMGNLCELHCMVDCKLLILVYRLLQILQWRLLVHSLMKKFLFEGPCCLLMMIPKRNYIHPLIVLVLLVPLYHLNHVIQMMLSMFPS